MLAHSSLAMISHVPLEKPSPLCDGLTLMADLDFNRLLPSLKSQDAHMARFQGYPKIIRKLTGIWGF